MGDKSLTDSINRQYSKYGSLRVKEKESKLELCNAEDPDKFLARIDMSIKDVKARVKKSIDKSTLSEEYDSSFDTQDAKFNSHDSIPLVKLDRTASSTTNPTRAVSSASESEILTCSKLILSKDNPSHSQTSLTTPNNNMPKCSSSTLQ